MQAILDALGRAFKSLFHPKMLVLTLWPMLLSLLFWGGLFWWFWDAWVGDLTRLSQGYGVEDRLTNWGFAWVAHWLVSLLLFSMMLPAIYVTSLLFTAIFVMPTMLNFVAERDYPELEKKRFGTNLGSVWSAVVAVVVFLLLWVLTLPLWLIPFGVFIVPTLLSAYLNQRLFIYDALTDHADRAEFDQIKERTQGRQFGMGALLGFVHYIPVLNFFTPIYIGLAFIHVNLTELRRMRVPELKAPKIEEDPFFAP